MMRHPFLAISFCLLTLLTAGGTAASVPGVHVYYLFQISADQECSGCYIPLLITHKAITQDNLSAGPVPLTVVTTYKRDSIWEIETNAKPITADDVSFSERALTYHGREYYYQEVGRDEALRLFNNPSGTIPIARPNPPIKPEQANFVLSLITELEN